MHIHDRISCDLYYDMHIHDCVRDFTPLAVPLIYMAAVVQPQLLTVLPVQHHKCNTRHLRHHAGKPNICLIVSVIAIAVDQDAILPAVAEKLSDILL